MSRQYSSSSSYQQSKNVSQSRNVDGELFDILGEQNATLAWGSGNTEGVVLSGGSDFSMLNGFKGALLALKSDFFGQGGEKITITGNKREELDRRLLLLEHEIDGVLKRRINFSVRDEQGGQRTMDYTGLLNEKENQIVELEKKIQNLEERLRRATRREKDLEDEIVKFHSAMRLLEKPNFNKSEIDRLFEVSSERRASLENYERLRNQVTAFAGLARTQFDKLRGQGIRMEFENDMNNLLRGDKLEVSVVNGIAQIGSFSERVVEIPVQDARTKHLVHMLAVQMKKYFEKYPKLKEECDVRLFEFFQQEIIDVMEVDEFDRLV